jgi:hypothetical protein
MEDVVRLSIQQLLGNSLIDPRRHLDLDRVQRYAQLLGELPPVTVFRLEDQTLLLVDGFHRVAAAQEAGRTTVDADIRDGTLAEAVQFAAEVAVLERGLSDEQAREAIKRHSGGRWPTSASARTASSPTDSELELDAGHPPCDGSAERRRPEAATDPLELPGQVDRRAVLQVRGDDLYSDGKTVVGEADGGHRRG